MTQTELLLARPAGGLQRSKDLRKLMKGFPLPGTLFTLLIKTDSHPGGHLRMKLVPILLVLFGQAHHRSPEGDYGVDQAGQK